MRKKERRMALATAILLVAGVPAAAKTRIEKVTVCGARLNRPIEITEDAVLQLSNPWYGKFIKWGAVTAAPPTGTPVYNVTLHAHLRSSELRPIYQFRYAPSADGRGFVYLPGAGEPWHGQNVSIILRGPHDGHWSIAGAEWDAKMRAALGQ